MTLRFHYAEDIIANFIATGMKYSGGKKRALTRQ